MQYASASDQANQEQSYDNARTSQGPGNGPGVAARAPALARAACGPFDEAVERQREDEHRAAGDLQLEHRDVCNREEVLDQQIGDAAESRAEHSARGRRGG